MYRPEKCADRGPWHRFWHDCRLDMAKFRTFLAWTLIGILALAAVGSGAVIAVDRAKCRTIAAETGLPTRWTLTAGCFVEQGGEWLPYDRWVNVHSVDGAPLSGAYAEVVAILERGRPL